MHKYDTAGKYGYCVGFGLYLNSVYLNGTSTFNFNVWYTISQEVFYILNMLK